jgi:hypothetical protein
MRILNSIEAMAVAGGRTEDERRKLLEEVLVHGSSGGGAPWAHPYVVGAGNGEAWSGMFIGERGGGGGGEDNRPEDSRADAVKKEIEKMAKQTAEKLEEVTVEAQKCGIPLSTLFNFSTGESGAVWKKCFENLPQKEKDNLRDALNTIAAGMTLEKSFNPIKIAVNVMLHEERLMLGHLAAALSANDGWQFGENLATLSKRGMG